MHTTLQLLLTQQAAGLYSQSMKSDVIKSACNEVSEGHLEQAKSIITEQYPFEPLRNDGRKYGVQQKTDVFVRDGFVDRYSGEKLVFPPVLRLLSLLMPNEFPFHKNWKMSECHIGYWQLLPTLDHIIPVSRGGIDKASNWVCTSQLRNSAKSNWLLQEIGWKLHDPGNLDDWDGMMEWFLGYASEDDSILNDPYIHSWHRAALKAIHP